MKDLGTLSCFLGIKVASSPSGYLISQSKYPMDVIEHAYLTDIKTVDTPLESNAQYSSSDGGPLTNLTLYRTMVGYLVYLTITHPNIAYAVHIVSQFFSAPTAVHWVAVVRILRYLHSTCFQSLLFPSTSSLVLRTHSDVDWASDLIDRKSTTDFYMGVSHSSPTPMYCDNTSPIQISHNSLFHEFTKHIEIDCHLVRHHLQTGTISLPFVSSSL
ncbi:uncharacterized protein LOC111392041 [Olea europaea var. sylvestris]|uniref:uncharacterized protein LOC111392041 n=1 Tax=Olea europaea var. sylvestris TaxID=158386 RepID=UPI000C1CDB25|nr:uncharacterized protein LOC111392041 [Olea europaea var. sylvestris]